MQTNLFKEVEMPFASNIAVGELLSSRVLQELYREPLFLRQGRINQLQRLTHPIAQDVRYTCFPFPQTRLMHAEKMLAMAHALAQKFDFPEDDTEQFLLTVAMHDAFTPAGGDATMRLDKEKFCEVKNFTKLLIKSGLAAKWEKLFGFNAYDGQAWICGEDSYGFILDILDKISYTALDVFYLGERAPRKIKLLLKQHPLVMDIWRDIRITEKYIYFVDPDRLYQFLKLRALMHREFYLNPLCRKLEHLFFSETEKLYRSGKITEEELIEKDDHWLDAFVRKDKKADWCTEPGRITFRHFPLIQKQEVLCYSTALIHQEYLKPFKSGLDWPVLHQGVVSPLSQVLSRDKLNTLKELRSAHEGWYVYYYVK